MESWQGYNYYTRNPVRWVNLMNLSTAEWGVGYFPSNVVAIPGHLNSSYSFPNGTIVIQNASKARIGGHDRVEAIIFGITSGIALLLGLIWLIKNMNRCTQPDKIKEKHHPESASQGTGGTDMAVLGENGITDEQFRFQLRHYYYPREKAELEAYEKDLLTEGIDESDIENGTGLVRRMYGIDSHLWAKQHAPAVTLQDRSRQMCQSDAILGEMHRRVNDWEQTLHESQALGMTPEQELERYELAQVRQLLAGVGDERYPNKRHYDETSYTSRRSAAMGSV